jgi:putative phosphoribosyl transferase
MSCVVVSPHPARHPRGTTVIPFCNRTHAGQHLAAKLARYADRPDVIVLALPRGGVPVAFEVARRLHAPLDVLLVRKLGVPGHEELAMGAIATGGVLMLNDAIVSLTGVAPEQINEVIAREQIELQRREHAYRDNQPSPDLRGKTVVLVDDGLATGATMRAAAEGVRRQGAESVVVAVPVASADTCDELRSLADEVTCLVTPEPFQAVGIWYADFSATDDEEVRRLLAQARAESHTEASA